MSLNFYKHTLRSDEQQYTAEQCATIELNNREKTWQLTHALHGLICRFFKDKL